MDGTKKGTFEVNNEELILKHQLEEWKYLNDYVNHIDLNYHKTMTIIISVFSLITALIVREVLLSKEILFVVPAGIISSLAYLAYQFRIVAILRGHLSALENKMNETLGQEVHLWNSALVESYMAHNNAINNYMMIPMVLAVILLLYVCFDCTSKLAVPGYLFVAYWVVIIIFGVIILISFLKNDSVRHATENEKQVLDLYEKYKRKE